MLDGPVSTHCLSSLAAATCLPRNTLSYERFEDKYCVSRVPTCGRNTLLLDDLPEPLQTLLFLSSAAFTLFFFVLLFGIVRRVSGARGSECRGSEGEGSEGWRFRTKRSEVSGSLLASQGLVIVVEVIGLVEAGITIALLLVRISLLLIKPYLRTAARFVANLLITRTSKIALRSLVVFLLPHHFDDTCPHKWPCLASGLGAACASHCTEIFSRCFPDSSLERWPVCRFLMHSGRGFPPRTQYEIAILNTAASLIPKHFDASRPSQKWPADLSHAQYLAKLGLYKYGCKKNLDVTLKYPPAVTDYNALRLAFLLNVLEVHHTRSTSYRAPGSKHHRRMHRYDAFVPDWMRQDPAFKPNWLPRAYRRCCGCSVWEWRGARGALICLQHRWHIDMGVMAEVKWATEKGLI